MDSESIVRLAAREALLSDVQRTTIIDCQIRPVNIATVLLEVGITRWLHVMLFCPKDLRERRLRDRGWRSATSDTIENWTSILRREAIAADDLVIDTSRSSEDHVCEKILDRYEEWMRCGA
jgi:hypothetical protein